MIEMGFEPMKKRERKPVYQLFVEGIYFKAKTYLGHYSKGRADRWINRPVITPRFRVCRQSMWEQPAELQKSDCSISCCSPNNIFL